MCRIFLLLLFLFPALESFAADVPRVPVRLDTQAVHDMYLEGEFDRATGLLESAIQGGMVATHAESVFVYKHLGVMHAASEGTRERGKYYMLKLLSVEPSVRIMDMYASDMIYMIFRNIQEEFAISRERLVRAQGHVDGNAGRPGKGEAAPGTLPPPSAAVAPPPEAARASKPSRKPYLYYLGGAGMAAALVGVGIAVYHFSEAEPRTAVQNNDVE